jgi:hypothetical protein
MFLDRLESDHQLYSHVFGEDAGSEADYRKIQFATMGLKGDAYNHWLSIKTRHAT